MHGSMRGLTLGTALCAIATAAHRQDWHRKYIDYRALAEGLRVQTFWRRAGLTITGDPEFAHDNFMQKQDVELGWIRNVMRQVGLARTAPPQDPDEAARAVDQVVDAWVGRPGQSGQLAYYERKAVLRVQRDLPTAQASDTFGFSETAFAL